jgi:Tol biopolymer transport system component
VEGREAPTVIDIPEMAAFAPGGDPANQLAWSPDSQYLAVAMPVAPLGSFDVRLVNATTGDVRSLGFSAEGRFDLHWSPAGRRLLVHVAPTSTAAGRLRLIDVASSTGSDLPLPGVADARIRVDSWHLNGAVSLRHVNPASDDIENTFLVSVESGAGRQICSGQAFRLAAPGGFPNATTDICGEVTSDGLRQLVWIYGSRRLAVRDIETGTDRLLTSSGGEEYFGTLSPDGDRVVFVSNRDGQWGLYSAALLDGPVRSPRRLSAFDDVPTSVNVAAWTADGFVARVIRRESNLVRVNIDLATGRSVGYERLTQDGALNQGPAVSPDGQQVAYWSQQGSRYGIAAMTSNGVDERVIFETAQDRAGLQPTWASLSAIVFSSLSGDSRVLASLDLETGRPSMLGAVAGLPATVGFPRYLPATGEVAFRAEDFQTLRAQSTADGTQRDIATITDDDDAVVTSYLVSDDGRRIVYALGQPYSNGRACYSRSQTDVERVDEMLTTCEIGLIDLDLDTDERRTLATPRNLPSLAAWSPDGRFLLYGGGRPQVLELSTGASWPLLDQAVPLQWEGRSASWSPDGTYIVLGTTSVVDEWREWTGVR